MRVISFPYCFIATTVECNMKEQNVTSEVALDKIGSFVEDAWKTLNQALIENA